MNAPFARRTTAFRLLYSPATQPPSASRSEEHTSELQSLAYLVCRLLLEKKKNALVGLYSGNTSSLKAVLDRPSGYLFQRVCGSVVLSPGLCRCHESFSADIVVRRVVGPH